MKRFQTTIAKLLLPALLLSVTPLAAPSAQAESLLRPMKVKFVYNPADSAEKIYANLERTAKRACTADRIRPVALRLIERECVRDLLDEAVSRINRPEVASLHVSHG